MLANNNTCQLIWLIILAITEEILFKIKKKKNNTQNKKHINIEKICAGTYMTEHKDVGFVLSKPE